jgi:hypothetical protein
VGSPDSLAQFVVLGVDLPLDLLERCASGSDEQTPILIVHALHPDQEKGLALIGAQST